MPLSRPLRRVLVVAGALVVLVLVALVALPLLLGGRIAERVKTELNRSLAARVDWADASLGIFRSFPNLTLGLDGATIVGVDRFAGDTLASIGSLRVVLDLPSAVRTALGGSDPVVVRAIELDRPRARLIVLEDGTANWDIMQDTTASEGGRAVEVSLRRFVIEDGALSLDNRASRLQALVGGLDQTLSGDFSKERFDIETALKADRVMLDFAGIRYLDDVRLGVNADIAANTAEKTYTLAEGSNLRLNALQLDASGTVASVDDRLRLDLAFAAPGRRFEQILSLVPAVYAHDFQSLRTTGTMAVAGRVQGEYGKNAFPAFQIRATVDSGAFQYPDLPLPARDIFLDLALTNPGGSPDSTVVNLERLHLVIGRNPVNARMVLRTPVSDPDVDARVDGRLDLADLQRTVKLDSIQELSGLVTANAAFHTRLSDLDQGRYERVTASGTVNVRDMTLRGEALRQPLVVREARLDLAPRRTELRSFDATIGRSDLRATGWLDNLLGYALRDEELRGSATLHSRRFVLDEWRSGESDLEVIPVPKGLDFTLDATVNELLYEDLEMTDARGRVRIRDQRLTLENFALRTLGGTVGMDGYYETTDPARPTFDLGLRLEELDIPSAVQSFVTIRTLAPVAKYASGRFSTELRLDGPLSRDMTPVFAALSGRGSLRTHDVAITDFPPLDRLAAATKLSLLDDPTMKAIRSQFEIRDGRMFVQPFSVPVGPITMNVSGSNGLDQSLDYDLRLRIPRELLGGEVNQAISGLVSRAAGAGLDLQAAPEITLGVELGGTITSPSLSVNLAEAGESIAAQAGQAVQEAAEQRAEAAVDTVRQRAAAEAERLVKEAEERADKIRAEAQSLAEKVKREGYAGADSLVARAKDPLARAAAEVAAQRLRQETDDRAAQIVREGDQRADALVAEARQATPSPSP